MKDYKDPINISISELFIFYKYESNNRIIVYASSYLEAKYAVLQFYPFGENIFNLNEYLLQKIPTDKLFEILNIEKNIYIGYQFILTEHEYTKLEPYIINKSDSIIHHQKVLTKQFVKANGGDPTLLLSTKEFINNLQENTINKESLKNQINQLLNIVGDIWFIEIYDKFGKNNNKYIVYGKSRYQCKKLIEKLNESYQSNRFTSYNRPETLIENNYVDDLTPRDIERYNKMVGFMKTNNIKKFPFSTIKNE